MKHPPRALAALALLMLPLAHAAALEAPQSIRPTWGVVVESLLDPSVSPQKVASPSLNFSLGAGVVMPFSPGSRFSLEPSGDLYLANYEYLNGRAVPTDNTFATAFGLGLLLDLPIVYTFPFRGGFSLGMGMGLCFDLRYAFTVDAPRAAETPLINGYFWDQGRFMTPSTVLRGEYQLTERVGFGFSGRVLWPLYNLWANEGYGFFDRAKYLIGLTIAYKLVPSGS